MSSLSGRSLTLAARMPSDRPRKLEQVALIMIDGTTIKGTLHRAPGTRTLDYLNHQAESFVAMTDAILVHSDTVEHTAFVAINKAHILRVIEADDGD